MCISESNAHKVEVPGVRVLIQRLRDIDPALGVRAEAVSQAGLLKLALEHGVITAEQYAATERYTHEQLYT